MQKFYSLIFLILILSFQIQAQNSVGPIAGISLAKFYNIEDPDPDEVSIDFKTGINFGVAFEAAINSHFSIQAELRYTQMGTIEKFDFGVGEEKATLSINYITIPILAKYRFGMNPTQFFILAGPRTGFGVGNITLIQDGQSSSESFEVAQVKKFDFGLEFGAGVAFKLGTANMFIDARYYFGLQKLNSGDLPGDANNSGLGINVGYLFPIGISK